MVDKLEKQLLKWVNSRGVLAAALSVGAAGALVCSAHESHAAASDEWFALTTPTQLMLMQARGRCHLPTGAAALTLVASGCPRGWSMWESGGGWS